MCETVLAETKVAAACTWLQEAFSQEIRSGQEEQQPARSSSLGSVLFLGPVLLACCHCAVL